MPSRRRSHVPSEHMFDKRINTIGSGAENKSDFLMIFYFVTFSKNYDQKHISMHYELSQIMSALVLK